MKKNSELTVLNVPLLDLGLGLGLALGLSLVLVLGLSLGLGLSIRLCLILGLAHRLTVRHMFRRTSHIRMCDVFRMCAHGHICQDVPTGTCGATLRAGVKIFEDVTSSTCAGHMFVNMCPQVTYSNV